MFPRLKVENYYIDPKTGKKTKKTVTRRDDGVIVNNHDVPLIDNVVQYIL